MKYALDTNTLIYFFQGMGNVQQKLLAKAPSDILLPAVVLFELETGIAKSQAPSKRRDQLNELLKVIQIIPFDAKAARIAADVRADLEQQGRMIGPLDNLIAASAKASGAILVTRNVSEFSRVAGLVVESWFE
ncbi:tRNA(fMet)-specific endonuclease VapC [Rheinheimera pacifica]|uniref:type II toxin-antitoxin system VapC family toxin n=1 Tax=Rheinheimera pacifica TaxID=173990 RepID=UPI0021682083|nr:type II toxin-antitoxin system VapC family toxin [Rheinheimera pacifica]MCS4308261.1 tRNA(fMet)-specific endonuclease VapC [Rheinheimera pacifica]